MKVGVYLIGNVPPSEGGGFSYMEKLIHTIDNHFFSEPIEICFVGRMSGKEVSLKKEYIQLAPFFWYKLFRALERLGVLSFFSKLFIDIDICNKADVKKLKSNNVDILLFPKQQYREINDFPFISMNWDVGHKSSYAFPEFVNDANYKSRQKWYESEMLKAFAIFVESESGKEELLNYLSYREDKIYVVPIFPGRVVDLVIETHQQEEILHKFGLNKQAYFFYPAQFWPHKNHYNLILAFKKLLDNNSNANVKLVFTGSDYGNRSYIESVIVKYDLQKDIRILGFISNEEIYTLYKNSIALVMPTFLGPTNMPLMEAMAIGTAVICSDFEGHREICGKSAIYINPKSSDLISEAMGLILNDGNRETLISESKIAHQQSNFKIQNSIKALEQALVDLTPIRKVFF